MMARNTRNTTLWMLALLVALSGIWMLTMWLDEHRENTFQHQFPKIPVQDIHTLKIYARSENHAEVVIFLSGDEWRVMRGTTNMPLHEGRIEILLEELEKLRPSRLKGTTREQWAELEMEDSLATRVIAIGNQGVIIDFKIGAFQYYDNRKGKSPDEPPDRSRGITYVRLTDGEQVYSAENFFGPNFNQVFSTWRNQRILKLDVRELEQIEFRYSDEHIYTFEIEEPDVWKYKNAFMPEEPRLQYTMAMLDTKHSYFADAYRPEAGPLFEVAYQMKDAEEVIVRAYEAPSGQIIIHSSMNPETYFLDYNERLLELLFPPMDFFFP